MLSVLKALFALDSGFIAPNMHFTKPNPKIQSIIDGQLKVSFLFIQNSLQKFVRTFMQIKLF